MELQRALAPDLQSDIFWRRAGIDPDQARARCASARIGVIVRSSSRSTALFDALRGWGIAAEEGPGQELTVMALDSYLDPWLMDFDSERRDQGKSWLPVKAMGVESWFGPVFAPDGACYGCLRRRLRLRDGLGTYLAEAGDGVPPMPPTAGTPSSLMLGYTRAAAAIANWVIRGTDPVLERRLVTYSFETGRERRHPVAPDAGCPICGGVLPADPGVVFSDLRLTYPAASRY